MIAVLSVGIWAVTSQTIACRSRVIAISGSRSSASVTSCWAFAPVTPIGPLTVTVVFWNVTFSYFSDHICNTSRDLVYKKYINIYKYTNDINCTNLNSQFAKKLFHATQFDCVAWNNFIVNCEFKFVLGCALLLNPIGHYPCLVELGELIPQ